MTIETLGEAFRAGWRVKVRCAQGKRDGMKSIRECLRDAELDMETLVWTRGANMPLSDLGTRLRCPICRSLKVAVLFEPPPLLNAGQVRDADPRKDISGLPHRVEVLGPGGSFDRMIALCAHADEAHAAYKAAVKRIELREGETLTLRVHGRCVSSHPDRPPKPYDREAECVAYEKLREGAPKGYTRRFK